MPPPLTVLRVWPQLRVNQEELSEGSSGSPGEEQEEDDPEAEVRAFAQPRRVSGDQVGQVQHVAKCPADRSVPGLRATGAA